LVPLFGPVIKLQSDKLQERFLQPTSAISYAASLIDDQNYSALIDKLVVKVEPTNTGSNFYAKAPSNIL
jgi:hypothetical protein